MSLFQAACIIHDICYETGRPQSDCDGEFHHNILQLCGERESCDYDARVMLWAVSDWGEAHMEERLDCSGSYTASCPARERGTFDLGEAKLAIPRRGLTDICVFQESPATRLACGRPPAPPAPWGRRESVTVRTVRSPRAGSSLTAQQGQPTLPLSSPECL